MTPDLERLETLLREEAELLRDIKPTARLLKQAAAAIRSLEKERESVVAWLRAQSDKTTDIIAAAVVLKRAADAIERGDHLVPLEARNGE